MMADLWLVALAGLVASVHCAGMCGPLVLSCNRPQQLVDTISLPSSKSIRTASILRAATPHLLYNSGRVLSYGLLGALAGLVGATITSVLRIGPWLSYSLGLWLLIAGFLALRPLGTIQFAWLSRPAQALRSLTASRSNESRFVLGFLTPLLPCGLVYTMLIKAAATSNPFQGLLELSTFALASSPMLLTMGVASTFASSRFARHARTLTATIMIAIGIVTLMRGAQANPLASLVTGNADCCSTTHEVGHKH